MQSPCCKPRMGRGDISLLSSRGVLARLVSNLRHPGRERSIVLNFHDGRRRVGHFPVSGDDSYSQLVDYSNAGAVTGHEIFRDEPLAACLETYYRFFDRADGGSPAAPPPGADLDFNVDVVRWLDDAKRLAALRPAPAAPSPRVPA